MNDSRERILEVSAQLFARRGYSAVSIRDICKKVGIKESSVYYHFANKQGIFDELLERFGATANTLMRMLDGPVSSADRLAAEDIRVIGEYFFDRYLMDDFCNQVMRAMQIEQYGNERVQELYLHWMLDEPVRFQSRVFSALMKAGALPEADSAYLAVRFYSPILYYAQKWLFSGELDEGKKAAFRAAAYAHIQRFFSGGAHV